MTPAETFTPANESTLPRPTLNPHSLDTTQTDYRARYYSSNDARFMSPDWSSDPEAVPYAKLKNPQSLNLYEYMLDNPLGGVDKDGHACIFGVTVFGSWFGGRCPGSSTPAPPAATPQPPPPGAGQVGLDGVPPPAPLNANGTIACGCRQNTNQQQNSQQQQNSHKMLGENGTQTTSKTLWEDGKEHIDVENPNPGQRPGQIHYQSKTGKYIYDVATGRFKGLSNTQSERLMSKPGVQEAIQKGLKYLGVEQ